MSKALSIQLKPVLDRLGDDAPYELDLRTALQALDDVVIVQALAEFHQLELIARICELNATLTADESPVIPGGERLRRYGGDGTPRVREFCIDTIGVRLAMPTHRAEFLVTDALDLKFRLPSTWARLATGRVDVWRARKLAQATHDLSAAAAAIVDARVADLLDTITGRRLDQIIEAAIITADPEAADCATEAVRDSRQVTVEPHTRYGTKDMFIRADAADVLRFSATIDFIGDLLGLDGDTDPKSVRRSKAIGVVADPNQVLDLYARTRASSDRTPNARMPSLPALPGVQAELCFGVEAGSVAVDTDLDPPQQLGWTRP